MKVLLLFTYGVSLKLWDKLGLIDREISLYNKLREKKIKFKFLTYGDDKDLKFKNKLNSIEIVPISKIIKSFYNFFKSFLLPLRLKKILQDVDIIKTNQLNGWWIGGISKLLYNKTLIIRGGYDWLARYIHGYKSKKNLNWFRYLLNYSWIFINELLAYKLADAIILTSDLDIDFIVRTFKLKKKKRKIHHFYNYIDIELFKPMNINKYKKSILFIGNLSHQKNIFNLLKAFINFKNFSLSIIGQGPLEESIKRFIIDHRLNVNLLGIFPNNKIPEVINQHEIFILPSYSEGNPKVLLEAMSCEIPCIGTNVWGIKNLIKHKYNGYLCEKSSKSIKSAIIELYRDKKLREMIGKNAREYILNNCSLDLIVEREYSLYRELLKR